MKIAFNTYIDSDLKQQVKETMEARGISNLTDALEMAFEQWVGVVPAGLLETVNKDERKFLEGLLRALRANDKAIKPVCDGLKVMISNQGYEDEPQAPREREKHKRSKVG